MKRTAMDHPKLLMLQQKLGLEKPAAVGILECLWHFTAHHTPDGRIGKYPPAVVALKIGHSGDPRALFDALEECGWVEQTARGWVIHDWADHCDDAVHLRLARAGLRFVDGRMPAMTRLNARERKAALARYQGQEEIRAHAVRPAVAEAEAEAEACANADAEGVMPPGSANTSAKSQQSTPAARGAGNPPVSAAELLPQLLGAVQARQADLPGRIMRATGDPAPYRDWWVRVIRFMRSHDGEDTLHEALRHVEDCANPAVRAAKDLGTLRAPGAYLAGRCRDHLARHGLRLPPPPKAAAARV